MTDNTTELDFGTTAQKATDAEKLPVVLLALDQGRYDMARSLDELRALADANGMDAVAEVVQKRATPEAATLLGEGKVAEARLVCQNVNAAAAIFDGELTGSQIRNLSAALQVEVLDRTMLILEIFRARATTNEGKLQTELATLRYQLPRLQGLGEALSRQGGGGGGGGDANHRQHRSRKLHLLQASPGLPDYRQLQSSGLRELQLPELQEWALRALRMFRAFPERPLFQSFHRQGGGADDGGGSGALHPEAAGRQGLQLVPLQSPQHPHPDSELLRQRQVPGRRQAASG